MSMENPISLPDRPGEMPMPPQGEWVRTGGGAVGRFVGRSEAGVTWMWYPRHGERGLSFETMCERFKASQPQKRRKVKISDGGIWCIEDIVQRRVEAGDKVDLKVGKTFVEGPVDLLEEIAEQIEEEAWDAAEMAGCGIFDDHEGKLVFAEKSVVVNRFILARRLRGKHRGSRKVLWDQVVNAGRERGFGHW